MKLPQLIRNLLGLWILVFIVGFLAALYLTMTSVDSSQSGLMTAVTIVLWIVVGLSFCAFTFGAPLVRNIENAYLRWFGQPATATVLDFHGLARGRYTGQEVGGYRIKLEVHLSDGGSFETVAEDTPDVGWQLRIGETFPVKYDPLTKQVALVVMPKKPQEKEKDF